MILPKRGGRIMSEIQGDEEAKASIATTGIEARALHSTAITSWQIGINTTDDAADQDLRILGREVEGTVTVMAVAKSHLAHLLPGECVTPATILLSL